MNTASAFVPALLRNQPVYTISTPNTRPVNRRRTKIQRFALAAGQSITGFRTRAKDEHNLEYVGWHVCLFACPCVSEYAAAASGRYFLLLCAKLEPRMWVKMTNGME